MMNWKANARFTKEERKKKRSTDIEKSISVICQGESLLSFSWFSTLISLRIFTIFVRIARTIAREAQTQTLTK